MLFRSKDAHVGNSNRDAQEHTLQLIEALERLRHLVEIEIESLEEGIVDIGQFLGDLHRGFERLPASRKVDKFLSLDQIRLQILSKALESGKQDVIALPANPTAKSRRVLSLL